MILIPPGATVIRHSRLDLIALLKKFTSRDGRLDTLISETKKKMIDGEADYAASDYAVAQLRPAGGSDSPKKFVDPVKLHALIKKGRITLEQFLSVLCVRTSLMPQILSGSEIDAISVAASTGSGQGAGALYTNFKPDVSIDLPEIEKAMVGAIRGVIKV